MKADPQGIGGDLRGAVRRLGLEGVVLVDRDAERRAVDLTGGGQDDPLHRGELLGGQEDVRGPEDIGVDDLLRVLVRVRDSDQRGQMEDGMGVAYDRPDCVEVPNITVGDVDSPHDGFRDVGQTAAFSPRGVSQHGPHVCPFGHEPLDQGAADEPPCPRDHNSLICEAQCTSLDGLP